MNKTKKILSVAMSTAMISTMGLSLVGCGGGSGNNEKVDQTKTQITVSVFERGYGSEYAYKLKDRFEKLHAEDSYEEGKKGVQIHIKPTTDSDQTMSTSLFKAQQEDVYFAENAYYGVLANAGLLLDITDTVNATSSFDNKTIESKLNDQQKGYMNVGNKYYGVPHYQGEYGIVFDRDLFDENHFYFKKGYKLPSDFTANTCDPNVYKEFYDERFFVKNASDEKTAGPDCIEGTSDDGLPCTYDEFFLLLEHIYSSNTIPFSWAGTYYKTYLDRVMYSFLVDDEGFDDSVLNYSFDGTEKHLVDVSADGTVTPIGDTVISTANLSVIRKQEGFYNALKFMNGVINESRYHDNDARAFGNFEHTANQEYYLNSKWTKPVAMIMDGVWWQREASEFFDDVVAEHGEEYSKENRNFGWMPMPKSTKEKYESDNGASTHNDTMNSFIFAKASIPEFKIPLVKEFIQFACSDESLVEFTTTTNTLKAMKYTLTDSEQAKLTPFGKDLYRVCLSEKAKTVYPYAGGSVYVNNIDKLGPYILYTASTTSGVASLREKGNGTVRIKDVVDTFNAACTYTASILK